MKPRPWRARTHERARARNRGNAARDLCHAFATDQRSISEGDLARASWSSTRGAARLTLHVRVQVQVQVHLFYYLSFSEYTSHNTKVTRHFFAAQQTWQPNNSQGPRTVQTARSQHKERPASHRHRPPRTRRTKVRYSSLSQPIIHYYHLAVRTSYFVI